MTPDDPRHGTTAGYDTHLRHGEPSCADCRRAAALYENTLRMEKARGIRRTTTAVGVARRVQALVALGYTFRQIGEALGVAHDQPQKWARQDSYVRSSTLERVAALYDAWSMTPAPQTTGRQRWSTSYARTVAAKNGWVPPLAWDDIDDPDENPTIGADFHLEGDECQDIDPVVVARVLAGRPTPANPAERREIVRRCRREGRNLAELARLTGWKVERYYEPVSAPITTITPWNADEQVAS